VGTHWGIIAGDVATSLAALGTVSAVWVALRQARDNRRELAVRDQRAQAERVSAWYSGDRRESLDPPGANPTTEIRLLNQSFGPVYEVVVFLVFIQGAGPRRGEDWARVGSYRYCSVHTQLPPGSWTTTVPSGWAVMTGRASAEVAFTDAGGRHWVRRSTGKLEILTRDAIDHYAIERPVNYRVPQSR